MNNTNKKLDALLESIVTKRFDHIPTLERRNSDNLDFHEVSIWGLKEILTAAYEAGYAAGAKDSNKT